MSMSTEDGPKTQPEPANDFPVPRHFVLTPVKDGAYKKSLPKLTAVYLNCEKWPPGEFLSNLAGVSLDRDETDPERMHLSLFVPPEDLPDGMIEEITEENSMQVFADTGNFTLRARLEVMEDFWDNISKIKAFTLAVSTEDYYLEARVNFDSTEVTELDCTFRLLN
jgi:hypothetical protein